MFPLSWGIYSLEKEKVGGGGLERNGIGEKGKKEYANLKLYCAILYYGIIWIMF